MSSSMYQEYILDHYRQPRNRGRLASPDISHYGVNPLCGDALRIDVQLDGSGQRVEKILFSGEGCAISQASASIMTELAEGKTLAELQAWTRDDVLNWLGIPLSPMRLKCALLALKVLQAGIQQYEQRHRGSPAEAGTAQAASPS